ncbi:ATP-binding protein [Streptomyces sp. NPDC059411]|uniref:ATP-binding protein n=1 Tax=Streptomyces sp. NPDC059411 TaxID=3346825 RepID=UPI0036B59F61
MISHSRRHCVVELQALPLRIGQIRRIVSAQLRHWQLDPLIDRAALGVTELLSNVHRHAQPDKTCTVEIEFRLGRATDAVSHRDPRRPGRGATAGAGAEAQADNTDAGAGEVWEADALETSGRGLALVAAVSEAWGARHRADTPGKLVWFSLRAAPDPAALTPRPAHLAEKPVRSLAPAPSAAVPPEPVSAGLPVAASVGVRPG